MNNPTLSVFCGARLGRADIEGSKSDVAMDAWPPQASYPCGNYSDTSGMICSYYLAEPRKGSLALLSQSRFVLKIVNQASLYACVLREISVPTELALGHLRCCVTDMPPQPNSPSGRCLETRLPFHPKADGWCTKYPRLGPHEPHPKARTAEASRESAEHL